jgi:hypothetical protein
MFWTDFLSTACLFDFGCLVGGVVESVVVAEVVVVVEAVALSLVRALRFDLVGIDASGLEDEGEEDGDVDKHRRRRRGVVAVAG